MLIPSFDTVFVFHLLFSVVPDNKCTLSCAISPIGANSPLKESNDVKN